MFKTKLQLVEVDHSRPPLDESLRTSVATLAHHPGFKYLTTKLKLQAAVLRSKLERDRHKTLSDAEFLQSGLFWLNYLEDFVNAEVYSQSRSAPQDPTAIEAQEFARVHAALEKV